MVTRAFRGKKRASRGGEVIPALRQQPGVKRVEVKLSSELLQVPPITNWSAGANGEVVVEAPLRLAGDHLYTSTVVK